MNIAQERIQVIEGQVATRIGSVGTNYEVYNGSVPELIRVLRRMHGKRVRITFELLDAPYSVTVASADLHDKLTIEN